MANKGYLDLNKQKIDGLGAGVEIGALVVFAFLAIALALSLYCLRIYSTMELFYNASTKTYEHTHTIVARPGSTIDYIRKSLIGPQGKTIEGLKDEVAGRTNFRPFVCAKDDYVVIRSNNKEAATLMVSLVIAKEKMIVERTMVRQTYDIINPENVGRILGRDGHRTKTIAQTHRVNITFNSLEAPGKFLVVGQNANDVSAAVAELRASEEHIIAQAAEVVRVPIEPIDVTSILIPTAPVEPAMRKYAMAAAKPRTAPAPATLAPASLAPASLEPATPPKPAAKPTEPTAPRRIKLHLSDIINMPATASLEPVSLEPASLEPASLAVKMSWADMMDEEDELRAAGMM